MEKYNKPMIAALHLTINERIASCFEIVTQDDDCEIEGTLIPPEAPVES